MTAILSINDNNLLLQIGDSLYRTRGYAWLKGGDVSFDFDEHDNAVAASRLEPQQINSRYWQQCEQTALSSNDSGMRHAADLVWRHLAELQSRHALSEIILVVPSHYRAANLQLLLGIAKSCSLNVLGLVNKAVLAAQQQTNSEAVYTHVDVQLHQTVCTQVVQKNNVWQVGEVEILHEVGLHSMQDALLKAAQERFINSDRFDPLHYAETEQQLFDQLPMLASNIRQEGKASMRVVQAGRQYACSIDARQWANALQPFSEKLLAVEADSSANAGADAKTESKAAFQLFDFNQFAALSLSGGRRKTIAQGLLPEAKLAQLQKQDEAGHVVYQTSLPVEASSPAASRAEPQSSAAVSAETKPAITKTAPPAETPQPQNGTEPSEASAATHVLHQGIAVPISAAEITFKNQDFQIVSNGRGNLQELLAAGQLFVLAEPQRHALQVNDRLGSDLVDGVISVIRVE